MKLVSNNSMPCRCGFLERQANHPDSPIRFDPELSEYHFVHRTSKGNESRMMIYHCPFCGGKAPKSRRDNLFHRLPLAEMRRLGELTHNLRTVQEVTAAFGRPDINRPNGMISTTPERDGNPETTQAYPEMIYNKLSDVADVRVLIYPNDRVVISFEGKEIKATQG